ncbi:MAG: hypothetical protein IJS28_06990 [Synergistaceae bacterium]|nr:hypothetical protein [Synergistaceae bacterium]
MNILLEVMRWCFIGGICAVSGMLAFIAGGIVTLLVCGWISDAISWLRHKLWTGESV